MIYFCEAIGIKDIILILFEVKLTRRGRVGLMRWAESALRRGFR